jgi:aerobic-type carbon monoxide dehydrogenase small subunit (CoxS/CutS family)
MKNHDFFQIELKVNGTPLKIIIRPEQTLLEVLREELKLTGAKNGCGEGECGACTVLVNDQAVNSCLMLAGQANHCEVTTIEGLTENGQLHPVQEAFIQTGAVQCGFCTPGAILTAVALLRQSKNPSEEEIRQALSGNICRCTGYSKMIQAVQIAAEEMHHASP